MKPASSPGDEVGAAENVKLLQLENRDGYEYWLALHNFYVITRYNHSALYAMAVYQLAEAIREQYGTQGTDLKSVPE